jgi:prepilin-type N-terminal cleavage/methylation domain-containing protein
MMIQARRAGFTLVEFLVVIVLAAVIMGAVIQSLVVQERTYTAAGETVRGQDRVRVALGVLEAELRDIATDATTWGAALGGTDIMMASRDSIRFRAPRTLGFVCTKHNNDKRVWVWLASASEQLSAGVDTRFLVFRDDDPAETVDDSWFEAQGTPTAVTPATCANNSAGTVTAYITFNTSLPNDRLEGVWPGAPIRSFQEVRYSLDDVTDGWALRRRVGTRVDTLVTGLAGPGNGLTFTYFDSQGVQLTGDPISSAQIPNIAAIRVAARTDPHPGSRASPVESTTHIFLRNN